MSKYINREMAIIELQKLIPTSKYEPGYDLCRALEKIEALPTVDGLPVMRWISVWEDLPPVRHSVLIASRSGGTAEGEYRGNGEWVQYRWSVGRKTDVTHWMPKPEMP